MEGGARIRESGGEGGDIVRHVSCEGGRCFLCLIKLEPEGQGSGSEGELEEGQVEQSTLSAHLIQCLSRYLGVAVLIRNDEGVEGVVPLCEGCRSLLNQGFLEVYRKLKRIEVQMASCLQRIHGRLKGAEEIETGLGEEEGPKSKSSEQELREALRQKCFHKMRVELVKDHDKSDDASGHRGHRGHIRTECPEADEDSLSEERADQSGEDSSNDKETSGEDARMDDQAAPKSPPPVFTINPSTGKHKCPSCPKEFSSNSNAHTHFRSIHLTARYKCDLCTKEFPYLHNYKRHYANVHAGIRFRCEPCNKSFTLKDGLLHHQQKVHLGKRFDCRYCFKTFSESGYRNRHERSCKERLPKSNGNGNDEGQPRTVEDNSILPGASEENERGPGPEPESSPKFKCPTCDNRFETSGLLKTHVKSVHPPAPKEAHLCDLCGKRYLTLGKWVIHMKTHSSSTNSKPSLEMESSGK